MNITEAIYTVLSTAVNSTGAAGRVYPRADVPQAAARPYVAYGRVSGNRQHLVGGGSANHAAGRFQVTVYADRQVTAEALAAAIMATCRQPFGSHPAPIRVIDIESGPYDLPEMIEGAESKLAAVSVDLAITYKEH